MYLLSITKNCFAVFLPFLKKRNLIRLSETLLLLLLGCSAPILFNFHFVFELSRHKEESPIHQLFVNTELMSKIDV